MPSFIVDPRGHSKTAQVFAGVGVVVGPAEVEEEEVGLGFFVQHVAMSSAWQEMSAQCSMSFSLASS